MMNLYCISGLGADERLFIKLKPENYHLKFINWVKPEKNDTISSYSDKLISQIDLDHPFALLGVSLGGIIAVELSTKVNPEKIFVISSVKSSKEFPFYFKLFRLFRVKYIITSKLLKSAKPLVELFFGKMNGSDKQLVFKMIDDADNDFTPWAAKAIIQWHSKDRLIPFDKIVHIMGDKDLIFRYSRIKDCHVIKGGQHIMILNRTKEIQNIIESITLPTINA
ncbi:MAG: alpha/beta hydrolase [Pelobium sp.]